MKNLTKIGTLLAVCLSINLVQAQTDVPGPRFHPKAVEQTEATRPFATPGVFDYDAQVFAPLEFSSGEQLGPRSGFFATYDRMYTSLSRAGHNDTAAIDVPVGNNYQWGNRYKLGWMNSSDDGWLAEYSQSNGSYFSSGQDILIAQPMLTTTKFANFEINKVFRQALSRGGWFEPYIGMRYINLSDSTLEDGLVVITPGTAPSANRFKQNVTNSAFGMHIGGRYSRRRGRWRNSCDLALATTYNQSRFFATDITNTAGSITVFEAYQEAQSFVPVLDFNFDLGYNLSRDFGIRGGIHCMYMWDGIARANTLNTANNPNSIFGVSNSAPGLFEEGVLAAGFSFGIEWRR